MIDRIFEKMCVDERIFFLSADFGAPSLDKIRDKFSDRFINVGIAEQNLVNLATGLAIEGFTVYAYAIAGFLSMRAYEQIRVNLSLSSQHKDINVNLIGVGAGASYDVSGPSHHCFEDLTIIRALPNIVLFSPSDYVTAEKFVDFSVRVKRPKYLRLDGKALPAIYEPGADFDWGAGFHELAEGNDTCIVSTGQATHKALRVLENARKEGLNLGLIDVFLLKPIDAARLSLALRKYKSIITLEEAFVGKGGLDSLIVHLLNKEGSSIRVRSLGFGDTYIFKSGGREYLHEEAGFSEKDILRGIHDVTRKAPF